jgi:O-antigen ligase
VLLSKSPDFPMKGSQRAIAIAALNGSPPAVGRKWRLDGIIAPIVCGSLVAIAIACESWPLLAVIIAMFLVLLVPVEFAFGLLALAIFFDDLNPLGGSLTLSFLVAAASGAILLAVTLAGARFCNPPRAARWFVLLFLWTMLSAFWAMNPALCLERLPSVAALGGLYLIAVSMRISEREFVWVTRLIVFGGFVAALVSLYQYAHGLTVSSRASIILGSVVTNPNDLAATLILPLSLAVGRLFANRGVKRTLYLVFVILILVCLTLTMSRGGLAALTVVTGVYLYRKGWDWWLLILLGCIAGIVLAAPNLLATRMEEAFTSRAQGRFDIWLVGLEVIRHHGLFGVGVNNFPLAFQQYAGHQVIFRSFSMVPHNIYLQAIAETGLVGLLLLIGALGAQMKEVAGALRKGGAGTAALIVPYEAAAWGVIAHALVANLLWRKMFWFLWIVVALVVQVEQRTQRNKRVLGE